MLLPTPSSSAYWVMARSVVPPPMSMEAMRNVLPACSPGAGGRSGLAMAAKKASVRPA